MGGGGAIQKMWRWLILGEGAGWYHYHHPKKGFPRSAGSEGRILAGRLAIHRFEDRFGTATGRTALDPASQDVTNRRLQSCGLPFEGHRLGVICPCSIADRRNL